MYIYGAMIILCFNLVLLYAKLRLTPTERFLEINGQSPLTTIPGFSSWRSLAHACYMSYLLTRPTPKQKRITQHFSYISCEL